MLSQFTEYIRYVIETAAACMAVTYGMERKKGFYTIAAILLASGVVICLVLAGTVPAGGGAVYLILTVLGLSFVLLPYDGSIWNKLFSCMTGSMLRMCARKIFDVSVVLIDQPLLDRGQPLRYVLYYTIMVVIYAAAAAAFGRIFRKGRVFEFNWKITAVYAVMMVINLILNLIEPVIEAVSLRYYLMLVFCETAYYILLLLMQGILFQKTQAEVDAATARELWRQDKRQYEQLKENIETINIKCHDLRHFIREVQESAGGNDSGYLDEVARSISIYDSVVKTGNETLDVVLTDKRLRCETNRIQLTTMADGAALWNMDSMDIYSLFGNLLENAIDCELGIPDSEKRFISLTVNNAMQYANIHVENFFEGVLTMEDGLPVTTKGNDGTHGYGLKSVRRIVAKYDGTMAIKTEDNMFQVNILLQLTK